MTRFFLPGIAGANSDFPDVSPPELSTTAGNGPLAGQTLNFDLNLVNFDWVTWHQYEWENWVAVDALLNIAIGFLEIRGIWQPNSAYTAGESVFDPADITKLYLCLTNHTSGTDFDVDKPLYWELRTDANPPVTSVFGRIGAVTALEADYAAFYPTLSVYNTDQTAQDTAISANAGAISTNAAAIVALSNDLDNNYYTQSEADAAFVDVAGDIMTGDLQINKVNPAIFLYDTDGTADNRRTRIMQNDNRVRFSRVNDAGDTYTTLALIDEATITIRNPSGTWASMNSSGTVRGTAVIVDEGIFIKDDNVGGVYFRDSTDTEHYNIVHDLPNDNLDVNEDGVGTIARFDTLGTQLPDAVTLVTRQKGDGRYTRWAGAWSAGAYDPFQIVTHNDSTWLCMVTTTDEPTSASLDWIALGSSGGNITIGDAFPTVPTPENGDVHYKTADGIGLYVYYDDGDSQQWVMTNGGVVNIAEIPNDFNVTWQGSAIRRMKWGDSNTGFLGGDIVHFGTGSPSTTHSFAMRKFDTDTGTLENYMELLNYKTIFNKQGEFQESAGNSAVELQHKGSAGDYIFQSFARDVGFWDWAWAYEHSGELRLNRYDGAGNYVDTPIEFDYATGATRIKAAYALMYRTSEVVWGGASNAQWAIPFSGNTIIGDAGVTSDNAKFTVTRAGYYRVSYSCRIASTAVDGVRAVGWLGIGINGTADNLAFQSLYNRNITGSSFNANGAGGSNTAYFYLDVGDEVDLRGLITREDGGAPSHQVWRYGTALTIEWVGH